jgi:hypothetical protein
MELFFLKPAKRHHVMSRGARDDAVEIRRDGVVRRRQAARG